MAEFSIAVVFAPFVLYYIVWPALKWAANFFLPPKPTVYERLVNATEKNRSTR